MTSLKSPPPFLATAVMALPPLSTVQCELDIHRHSLDFILEPGSPPSADSDSVDESWISEDDDDSLPILSAVRASRSAAAANSVDLPPPSPPILPPQEDHGGRSNLRSAARREKNTSAKRRYVELINFSDEGSSRDSTGEWGELEKNFKEAVAVA